MRDWGDIYTLAEHERRGWTRSQRDMYHNLMRSQVAWERGQRALRARMNGLRLREIGDLMGVNHQRASQIVKRAERDKYRPPIAQAMESERSVRLMAMHMLNGQPVMG